MAEFHASMAVAYRQTEERHLVASRIHLAHAQRLDTWAQPNNSRMTRPALMGAVAAAAGSQSAVLTVHGDQHTEALVAASDATALAAHDLELTFAEGPSRDAVTDSGAVVASGTELPLRWPTYGPAVHELGVHAVVGIGLRAAHGCLGSLMIFDPDPFSPGTGVHDLSAIADAVIHSMLLAPDAISAEADWPTLRLFEREDFQPVLHQAAGTIHAASGHGIDNALALIRAHAFSEGRSVKSVAEDIVCGALTLS
jgi:hypothetical protein